MDTDVLVADPLDRYCAQLDHVFTRPTQREALRVYLQGLLIGTERHKTATGLANTEPGKAGSHHKAAQRLQWFLSESTWNPDALHQARVVLMRTVKGTAPSEDAVLVIDETGDRKYGTHTAHVGRQSLGSLGKVDSGIVTVHVLYETSQAYFPLLLRPYTPAHHFPRQSSDPAFRTKPQLAAELIEAVRHDWPFRAVVADCLYGRNEFFLTYLLKESIPFVMTLPRSYAWWHEQGEPGGVEEMALHAAPSDWHPFTRTFANGDERLFWRAELAGGPSGPGRALRQVVVTPVPVSLPADTTQYLITNLRERDQDVSPMRVSTPPASSLEVALLYARRPRIEQAYREVKQHLGWTHCQARSDLALRRHWSLVCAAFCFLHWWNDQSLGDADANVHQAGASHPPGWSLLLRQVRLWLEPFVWMWRAWCAYTTMRPPRPLWRLLQQVGRGSPLPLYAT
ncbi:IS701 family transposase (plasmid) [Deinococcus taeanensis]|uniref:IS701 family transposase n=1 Tax=Deinococcus taeanensis TaxID=2737050 RepID=UPI001CDB9847|nr:IS701 family transposase [Deinococcus taeanensis]UBV45098.1 IS701 family transposase [Deinococcus taeanensis]